MAYVVFDIETTGLNPWYGDRVTCICAKDSNGDIFEIAGELEVDIISSFLSWLGERRGYQLISKAGRSFDIPFLLTRLTIGFDNVDTFSHIMLINFSHFDLQEITNKWIGL